MSEITVTLTEKQLEKLKNYLNMQKPTRIREKNSWAESAKEKNPDGTPKYKHAKGNAQWWQETNVALDEVVEVLNNAIRRHRRDDSRIPAETETAVRGQGCTR